MPKSSKKKKDKNVDFAKARLKLGKGKQLANNATDTSFKARSIALPHQTIGLEKDASKPTTRRNLTLNDLLVHLKHHNSTTRKDALWGLRELLDANSRLIEPSLTPIIQACARIVGDEDAEVRKGLLAFFAWFLRLAPLHQLQPHAPFLILFITSAQTHIFPAIRIDAVRFLDLFLDFTPEAVIHGWNEPGSTGARVLDGYLGLLNVASGIWTAHKDNAPAPSTSSVTLSLTSKLVVLNSLASFLRTAISPTLRQESGIPTWYMASSFPSQEQFVAFCSLIRPRNSTTKDESNFELEWSNNLQETTVERFIGHFNGLSDLGVDLGFSLGGLGDIVKAVDVLAPNSATPSHSSATATRIACLAHTLHPILVSTWLDVAPTVFGVGASGGELMQLAVSVGQIASYLYGAVLRDINLPPDTYATVFDDLTSLLGYMSTYLPCISETGDTQTEDFLRNLSFAYCELTSLVVLSSQSDPRSTSTKVKDLKQKRVLATQVDRVREYVVKALDGDFKSSSNPLGYTLTASSYTMLLPTIWSLLKYQKHSETDVISNRICISTINHAMRTSSRSGTKRVAMQFVGLLVLFHSQTQAHHRYTPKEVERFSEWFIQLPKVLLEVASGDPLLTETILLLLLRIAQRRSRLFDMNILTSVRSRLIPYFGTMHPEKGRLWGPFTSLQQWPHLRRLGLDVISVLLQDVTVPDAEDLNLVVEEAVKGSADAHYWSSSRQAFRAGTQGSR